MRSYRLIAGIALAVLLVAIGFGIYQAGLAAGAAGTATAVPYPYHWYGFGFGFGPFGFFGVLLTIFLVFLLIRVIVGAGRGYGGRGYGGGGPRGWGDARWHGPAGGPEWEQRIREYHDRLHSAPSQPGATPSASTPDPRPDA